MNKAPPGPVLLVEPSRALLDAVLNRQPGREILCVSASAAHLASLRDASDIPAIVYFCGDVGKVRREFPLFWAEVYLHDDAAGLADSMAAGGVVHWQSAQAAVLAAGLVERGCYARFETTEAGVNMTAVTGTPAQAGLAPVPGWDALRIVLDALYLSAESDEASVSGAIRPFRQAWLLPADRRLSAGWPYRADAADPLPPTLPDGRPWPRISVVTPSFNQGRFIEETLLSVRQQAYPNLEHIVIDGGSNDDTLTILDRYRDHLAHLVSEPDRGQAHAINKGMALATGEILTWLNSDDMLAPGALAAVALGFATSGADLVAGICRIYRDGALVAEHMTACGDGPLPLDDLLDLDGGWNAGQFFYQPEVFFTRALWQRAGAAVDETLHYSMDYALWLRFAEQGAHLHVLGRALAWFRLHDAQKTNAQPAFKAELVAFRAAYLARTGRSLRAARPSAGHGRTLRIAIVNDIGWQYGAGIAQHRLAQAIESAGHTTISIGLTESAVAPGEPAAVTIAELENRIADSHPDLVLFGNVHGARLEPAALAPIMARWPSLAVLHDLWWLTGRCIYPQTCRKYLSGCDAACPTPTEYPALEPDRIARAWRDKRLLYAVAGAPVLLANSDWTEATARAALAATGVPPIERLRLGFPLATFRPRDRRHCRDRLDLPHDRFIVVASAASLLEPRKGADQLRDVIQRTDLPGILFVTTGHGDLGGLDFPASRVRSLGYVGDAERLALIYGAADVLISPSTEETFGQIFVEAIACGTPVIGHNLTGIAEAVRDGVTGLLTRAATADDLDSALLELYRRPALRKFLAGWGRRHVENEWSLASCYHSFFLALRRTGLADRLGLAHKITFPAAERSPVSPDFGAESWLWRRGSGIGPLEGPHPQYGILAAFHWCCGPESRFDLRCRQAGRHLLVIDYQNLYFDPLPVELRRGQEVLGSAVLEHTSVTRDALAYFPIDLTAGRHTLTLRFGRWHEPDAAEGRRLAIMLRRLDLIAL